MSIVNRIIIGIKLVLKNKSGLDSGNIVELIKATGKIENYLTPQKVKEFELDSGDVVELIKATGKIENYLILEKAIGLGLSIFDVIELIKSTGKTEEYLTQEKRIELRIGSRAVVELIKATGKKIEDYLTLEKRNELQFDSLDIAALINAIGRAEEYLTSEKIEEFGLRPYGIIELIKATGKIENYLTPQKVKEFGLDSYNIIELIKATGKIEEYLTLEKVREFGLNSGDVTKLIMATEKIENYLTPEKVKEFGLDSWYIVELIKAIEKVEEYLTPEKIREFEFNSRDVTQLIKSTREIDNYLTPEKMREFGFDSCDVTELIKSTRKIDNYLTSEKIKELGLDSRNVADLIKATEKIDNYLTPEKIKELGLDSSDIADLIKATGEIDTYLTPEKVKELGLDSRNVADLILTSGKLQKYSAKEIIEEYKLDGVGVAIILGLDEDNFIKRIESEIENKTYSVDKVIRVAEIIHELKETNSARLSRISTEIGFQVYSLVDAEQENAIAKLKQIYMTKNLPDVAKDFMVFEQLHPEFVSESKEILYGDRSNGDIPSLNNMKPSRRRRIIFSDLLRISIESNNRELKEYISIIEKGDKYFNDIKEGSLKIDDSLSEEKREILSRYAQILNTLYNQTSQVRRSGKNRENNQDIEQDLRELESLFKDNSRIHLTLPDRIVRTFGYWAGIRSFEQAKQMCIDIPRIADERNRTNAKTGNLILKKGDFVKGVASTRYFPFMLQRGSVAKDYIGQDATSDFTPLDMDVELIKYEGVDFKDTYTNLKTAPMYADTFAGGRSLGKIILVFDNDDSFVQTREGREISDEAISKVNSNSVRGEYFDNNGMGGENAYGIRTGISSTRIKCIVADRYVDKLGLEIAINGFYIPVVNDSGEVIFTPEMYDDFRSKMQGIRHYGIDEFKIDETAKSVEIQSLLGVIDRNFENTNHKREMLLKVLQKAIDGNGLTMATERKKELLPGIVEVIDTGSTGRGTNEPGDGDFDFMLRIDREILKDSESFKEKIKEALSELESPKEAGVTGGGDFRYKGVKIEGLDKPIDVDLTFVQRTDEIEFTTEECIKERLETIKRSNPEDYKYVIANILLAKKFLKSAGVYKKKSAPEPENGQPDIRGGLGAVGIENWVLQNGGSFEKAARGFIEVANTCEQLEEFQSKYAVWDFGENYIAGDNYPHDNFVYNMNQTGFEKMKFALTQYVQEIETKKTVKKGIAELVSEDRSAFNDGAYMKSIKDILGKVQTLQL